MVSVIRVPLRGLLVLVYVVTSVGCGEAPMEPCEPTTCEAEGRVCGSLEDGCGEVLTCGSCIDPLATCNEPVGQCECPYDACDGACCLADERCDAGQCVERGWYEVTVVSARAPDEHTVEVVLSHDTGRAAAETVASYGLDSPVGALQVQAASFDAASRTVTLTTARQKLGVEYTLEIDTTPDASEPLTASFLSADTAEFWVTDFADPSFADYLIVANRDGVGAHAVAYVEQGYTMPDTPQTLAEFDAAIYPTLTASYIAAPDFDGNGKIVLLGVDGGDGYGGYYNPVNQYPEAQTMSWWGLHSNEMEIVHVNVLMGTWYPVGVVTHEFGHLMYHERHGFQQEYWDYHDEGLAETGVHLVYGVNQQSLDYYFMDPQGIIGSGLSLVHWTWAQYENYAQAYMFWVYLASRAGSLDAVSELFDLSSGDPAQVDAWIAANLGSDFGTVQLEGRLAGWVRDPTGVYGYNGFLDLSTQPPPTTVFAGTTSLDLEPFTGAFFRLSSASVDYPGTEGANVVYAGVNAAGEVDLTAPFDVQGGALLVFNASQNASSNPTEHSGPDLPAALPWLPSRRAVAAPLDPSAVPTAWLDPPPLDPHRRAALRAWRTHTRAARAARFR